MDTNILYRVERNEICYSPYFDLLIYILQQFPFILQHCPNTSSPNTMADYIISYLKCSNSYLV